MWGGRVGRTGIFCVGLQPLEKNPECGEGLNGRKGKIEGVIAIRVNVLRERESLNNKKELSRGKRLGQGGKGIRGGPRGKKAV